MSEFNVTAPVTRAEARQIPCTSCGVKAGEMCWGNGPIYDFEHPVRHKAAKQARFDRWLAQHDREIAVRTWDECMLTPAGSRVNPYRTA